MSKKSTIKANTSFWSQLEIDIDQYARRARKNIKMYETIQYNKQIKKKQSKSRQRSAELIENPSLTSINSLRSKNRSEKEKAILIRNRLHYLKVEKNRRLQSSDIARKKYQKVLSIRSQSIKDKEFINQEIETYKDSDFQLQRQKAERVKSQKWKIGKSIQNIRQMAFSSAKKVRAQSAKNEILIYERKEEDLKERKLKVQKVQFEEGQSRKRLLFLEKQKIQRGKDNHDKKLWNQFKTYQLRHRNNKILLAKFKKQAKTIHEEKIQAEKNLSIYSQTLRLKSQREKKMEKTKETNEETKQQQSQQIYLTLN